MSDLMHSYVIKTMSQGLIRMLTQHRPAAVAAGDELAVGMGLLGRVWLRIDQAERYVRDQSSLTLLIAKAPPDEKSGSL
jgi:hypothetical protein